MNEEAFIIKVKSTIELQPLMGNNIALMNYAKREYPHLNLETISRYRRKYMNKKTPTEIRLENSIMVFL